MSVGLGAVRFRTRGSRGGTADVIVVEADMLESLSCSFLLQIGISGRCYLGLAFTVRGSGFFPDVDELFALFSIVSKSEAVKGG
jgi:hypothetical protein